MNAKFTPGPWYWDSDAVKGDPLNRVRFQVVARGRTIAQTYYSSGDAQAQADTVLMACAPELLAALEESIEREHNPFEPDNQSARYGRLIALRAKATGKPQ